MLTLMWIVIGLFSLCYVVRWFCDFVEWLTTPTKPEQPKKIEYWRYSDMG